MKKIQLTNYISFCHKILNDIKASHINSASMIVHVQYINFFKV